MIKSSTAPRESSILSSNNGIIDSVVDTLVDLIMGFGSSLEASSPFLVLGIFFALMIWGGMGCPLNSDLLMLLAGFYCVKYPQLSPYFIFLSFLGLLIGDGILMVLSKQYGRRILNLWPFSHFLDEQKMSQISHLLKRNAIGGIILCRLLPGSRSLTFIVCGLSALKLKSYLAANSIALALWTPFLHYSAKHLGKSLEESQESLAALTSHLWLIAVSVAFAYATYRMVIKRWLQKKIY